MKKTFKEYKQEVLTKTSREDNLFNFMLDKLQTAILKDKTGEINLLIKTIKLLFPKSKEVCIFDTIFTANWKLKQYKKAIQAYNKGKKPFWHADKVGRYYEELGLIKKAMAEYEYLIDTYLKMGKDFLPLPGGPEELFKLGQWYAAKNPTKAIKYLTLYLKAEKADAGTGRKLTYKNKAQALLEEINKE